MAAKHAEVAKKAEGSMAAKSTPAGSGDPIASLIADHRKVKALFKEFAGMREDGSSEDKQRVVAEICTELKIHATVEEELFYPAVREEIDEDDLMDEALVEHAGAKELIAQLESMMPDDDLYDAKVTVLGEQIDHHVEEEEGEMFPKAKKAKVNTPELASEMEARREELKADFGAEADEEEAE
jgi:hemerythrin superfamily protein